MSTVPPPAPAGQDRPLTLPATWPLETRAIVEALRLLAFDAVAPRGHRQYSREFLRRSFRNRFRALDARLVALDPPPPVEPARTP